MLQKTYLHSGWQFAEKSWPGKRHATIETGWLPAQVPGHVHLDLVGNGIIADPFVRMNELGCQWVDEKDWSYQTTFDWSPKEGCPKRVLRFDGLDTICSIYLNDELLAEHDNMFIPLEVDVTEKLKEGENHLRVDFQSAVRVGLERRAAYFEKHGIKEDTAWFDERAFVRKAQYMFGWDWGPRLVSCGIWKPVCLVEYAGRILDVHTTQELHEDGSVTVTIQSEVEGEGSIVYWLGTRTVLVGDGSYTIVDDPYIWSCKNPDWTWVRSELMPPGKALDELQALSGEPLEKGTSWLDSSFSEGSLDSNYIGIGLNRVKLLREPDQFGESFEFEVNGQKIWARGANWIPDHSFPSVIDKPRLRDRLEKCKDMGFNMLRVWGGGLYESDDFYDLCDQLGILVWQDFPFACSYYPDDEHWQEVIRKEAEVNIKRLRNHPCLALWCGNNENSEMHETRWGGDRQPPRFHGENLFDKVLPDLVEELDPGRSYIPTSPVGNRPDDSQRPEAKSEKLKGPNADWYGDQHNWDAWHGRGDWRFYSDSGGRFSSEYGFASSCSLPVWQKTLAPEDWNPHSQVVQWHDRTGKGHDTFHGFVRLHYPEPVTLEDWVYYSQLNQRDALRHGVEHYRRSPFCSGSLIWQLNDCWPVQSWSILDSDGNYKALAYELRRLYADLLFSIERKNEKVKLWAVNHSDAIWERTVRLKAVHLTTGETLRQWEAPINVQPGQIAQAFEGDLTGLPVPDTILIGDKDTWQLLAEPKNARFAKPEPILISTAEDGYLKLRLTKPVVDLMLTHKGNPMPFDDNFLTALPGDHLVDCDQVPDSIEARSLSGIHPIHLTRSPI